MNPAAPPARQRPRRPSARAAFSLTELLVSTAIASFAIAGVLATFVAIQRGYAATTDSIMETNRFVVVQDQLGLDLRNAVSVVESTPTRLRIHVRYYDDEATASRLVTYTFDPGTGILRRLVGNATQVIMTDLESAAFTYFRRSVAGVVTPTTIAAEVNAVQLTLTSRTRVGGASRVQMALATTRFQLRRIVFP